MQLTSWGGQLKLIFAFQAVNAFFFGFLGSSTSKMKNHKPKNDVHQNINAWRGALDVGIRKNGFYVFCGQDSPFFCF